MDNGKIRLNDYNNKMSESVMESNLVSVIIPVYNAEKYLKSCIESVINQTYHNIEIIIVNDGSTDKSLDICLHYQQIDSRILVINQKNRGVSAARNAGLDRATGKYISFVDSDDELYKDAIELLIQNIFLYNADISSALKCNVLPCDNIKGACEDFRIYTYSDIQSIDLAFYNMSQSSCAKLYKYSFIKDIRFIEGKCVNEDGYFLFECYLKKPKVVQYNRYVYKYFVRDNSVSRSAFSEKYLDMLFFLDRKKKLIENKYPYLEKKFIDVEMRTHLLFLQVLLRTNDRKYKNLERDSIRVVKKNYKMIDKQRQTTHEKRISWIIYHDLYSWYKALLRIMSKV